MSPRDPHEPPDDLDEMVAAFSREDPAFKGLYEADLARGELLFALRDIRRALGLTQTQVAAAMGTSQSAVAKLERAESDPRLSTVARYALAVGHDLHYVLTPHGEAGAREDRGRPRAG